MATQEELYATMAALQATIREYFAPIAAEHNKPLDPGLVSALMFDRETGDDGAKHWLVHIYTLSPGLVIGHRGATASELRDRLVEVASDPDLRVNIVDFGKIHTARKELAS